MLCSNNKTMTDTALEELREQWLFHKKIIKTKKAA